MSSDKMYASVADFYAGKSVFITGGTGFLGKAFIEKILYTCPEINKIYVLIREKNGVSTEERLKQYLENQIFTRLKEKRPEDLKKVVPISGDITARNLGIKPEDISLLEEEVAIVIHSAATVRFNEPLEEAWKTNVEGTRMMLELSRRMRKLEWYNHEYIGRSTKSDQLDGNWLPLRSPPDSDLPYNWRGFNIIRGNLCDLAMAQNSSKELIIHAMAMVFIYISTVYTNTNREFIDEVLYPAPAAFSDVLARVKKGVTEKETEEMLNGHPNTYTFTKALTEHIVADNHGIIPVVIVRPSIVTAAKEDPIKGWLDNWYGCTGITTATAHGLNRITYGDESNIIDLIPVDYVTNLVIVAGARHDRYHRSKDVAVYNCCSSNCNPITLGKIMRTFREEALKCDNSIFSIPLMFSTSEWLVWFVTLLLQIIPAYCADFWRQLIGKTPRFVKMQSMVIQTRAAVAYFTCHSWIMKSAAARSLYTELSPSDRRIFPCDPTDIDWDEYMRNYFWGVRKFLEKKV